MTLSAVHVIATGWALLVLVVLGAVASKRQGGSKAALEVYVARRMASWRTDPVLWARERLGVEVTPDQAAVMRDVAEHPHTAWRSGRKCGKSRTLGMIALWWADTKPEALVILTSGNASQVRVILWREISKLYRNAKVPFGGTLHTDPSTGIKFPDGRLIVGLTAADPSRLQGYSGHALLFLVDEASGFDDALLEAIMGNLGGAGSAVLLAGNPVRVTGLFARVFREMLDGWQRHHTSSRVIANTITTIRGLANKAWIAFMEATYGVPSAVVSAHVDGEFPGEDADAVIPFAWLEAAKARWSKDTTGSGVLEVGVDPARFGSDASGIQGRRGYRALPGVQHRKLDVIEVAARALEYVRTHRRGVEHVIVRVDVGGLGAGVYDNLRRTAPEGVRVEAVNSSWTSRHPTRFRNTRSELWWGLRAWFQRGGAVPPGNDTRDAELLCARYSSDEKLRVVVASKDAMKAVLKRSPDQADALALAVYGESPVDLAPRREQTQAEKDRAFFDKHYGRRPYAIGDDLRGLGGNRPFGGEGV